jgi:hypothetical protein
MKRDMDLIRKILRKIRDHEDPYGLDGIPEIEGYSKKEISYNIGILKDADLLTARPQKNGVKSRSLTFVNIFFGQKGINQLFDYLFVFFLNFLELRQQLSVFKFCLCNICRRPFAEIVTGNAESIAHSLLGVGRGSGYSPFIVAGHHFGHISATYTWKTWFVPYFPIYDDCLMG